MPQLMAMFTAMEVELPLPTRILLDPENPFDDAVRVAEDETIHDETGVLEMKN